MLFKDRHDAGRQLAAKLRRYAGRNDVVVLALPRGGVPVGYEVAEAIGAALILLWFSHKVASEKIEMPLDTRWISWIILATAVSWVLITRALRAQTVDAEKPTRTVQDIVDCERFPDQCPCTTELGKGVP